MYSNYSQILAQLKSNSHFRELKDFEKKDEKYIYFMPPVFFRLLLAFEHKKKVNEHLNILYENFKRKLINGVDYNYL